MVLETKTKVPISPEVQQELLAKFLKLGAAADAAAIVTDCMTAEEVQTVLEELIEQQKLTQDTLNTLVESGMDELMQVGAY